jgi:hypothetical protein
MPGLINSTNYKFNLNNYFILTKTKHIYTHRLCGLHRERELFMCYVSFDVKMSLNIMMRNI